MIMRSTILSPQIGSAEKFLAREGCRFLSATEFPQDSASVIQGSTMPEGSAASLGFNTAKLQRIDSICKRAIELQAAPDAWSSLQKWAGGI